MSSSPTVIVRKGGFFSALFHGIFGLAITLVLCVSALGFFALRFLDSRTSDVLALSHGIVAGLPDWVGALPPVFSDALNDRRAIDYRQQVAIEVDTAATRHGRHDGCVVVKATNNGSETISLLVLNIVLDDDSGVPIEDFRTFVATPLAFDDCEWRGPLHPGETRRFAARHIDPDDIEDVSYEMVELRVWNGEDGAREAPATAAATAETPVAALPEP
jgi:acyl dehydratase